MVASLAGPYLDQSKLAIVILKSAWQSGYFKALLKPSLCDSSDGLLLGRRPGGRWTILSSLSIRQGLPARWAGSYLPVSLGQKWASYLQVGLWEMDELILGRGIQQIILFLILGPGWTSPRPGFLGRGIQSQSLKSVSLQNQGNCCSQGRKK